MASASEAQRDGDLLQHISRYCEDAMDAAKQTGSEALFMDSRSLSLIHICNGKRQRFGRARVS